MRTTYNLFAGQNLERLAALSDGVFAVAMTLLVLDLHVSSIHVTTSKTTGWEREQALLLALGTLLPNIVPYVMSFLTLGIFWIGQQTQFNHFTRSDRNLAWIHLAFLLTVTLVPFSTSLLASFITYRVALIAYWLNILLLGVVLFGSWRYALRTGLVSGDTTAEISAAHERRIVIAQILYACGALLCIVNTYISIAVIFLVQLNYAIAPRIRLLYQL